jgi:ABC-type nitrate/sulfonate/bicarbonate transport system substrate-binding protein
MERIGSSSTGVGTEALFAAPSRRDVLRRVLVGGGLLFTSSALAACGDDTTPSSTNGSGDGMEELRLSVGSPSVNFGAYWIAKGEDLFAKHGLRLPDVNVHAQATDDALLVSEQIDVNLTSLGGGMHMAAEGIRAQFIWNIANLGPGVLFVAAREGLSSMEDLAALGGDGKVSMTTQGTGGYGFWLLLKEAYGLDSQEMQVDSPDSAQAALVGGRVDAIVIPPNQALALEEKGRAVLIYDPRSLPEEEARRIVPEPFPFVAVIGLKKNMNTKREAITRLVAALKEGNDLLLERSPSELADISIKAEPLFAETPRQALEDGWALMKTLVSQDGGHISEEAWDLSVAEHAEMGIEIDPSNPALSYANMVDMSYLEAAE